MTKLSVELRDVIDSLVKDHQFVIENDSYDEAQFGNAVLELSSPDMKVRFLRDRGQTFVNVRGAGGDWLTLELVFSFLNIPEKVELNAISAANALMRNLERVRHALSVDEVALSDLKKKTRAELINKFRK